MKCNFLLKDIQQNGYAEVDLDISEITARAMSGFTEFLKNDIEDRKLWTFQIKKEGLNSEIGYVPREGDVNTMTGYSYDHKDVFHFNPVLIELATKKGLNTQEYQDWFSDLSILYKKSKEVSVCMVKEMANIYRNSQFAYMAKTIQNNEYHILRLLNYHMKERLEEEIIGLGHTDEWILTLNLGENMPGLRVGKKGNTHLLKIKPDATLIYPGKKSELLSSGAIKALYHEVVKLDHKKTIEKNRMAVTFFCN